MTFAPGDEVWIRFNGMSVRTQYFKPWGKKHVVFHPLYLVDKHLTVEKVWDRRPVVISRRTKTSSTTSSITSQDTVTLPPSETSASTRVSLRLRPSTSGSNSSKAKGS